MKQKIIVDNDYKRFEERVNAEMNFGYRMVPGSLQIAGGVHGVAVDGYDNVAWKQEFRYAVTLEK
ncbi:MAG: hypothetical protein ACO29Q_04745 [Crocinitomicaceae bacterium]